MEPSAIFKTLIQKHSSEIGDCSAFVSSTQSISYKKLETFSSGLELFLRKNKVSSQSPVLIFLPQSVELALLASALIYSGVPALITPTGIKAHEVDQLLADYPFSALITSEEFKDKLKKSARFQDNVMNIEIERTKFSFYKLTDEIKTSVDFSWLLMTSGSTGKSKIVMMSALNLQERTLGEIDLFEIRPQSKILNVLPFSHDIGFNQLLTSIYTGSTLEIFTKRLPVEFANRMIEGGFDGVSSMPQIWNNFIQIAKKLNFKIAHACYITVSGGSLPVEKLVELREIFINAKIFKTYGQTETFRSLAEVEQDFFVKNSCGKIIAGVDLLLVNENDQVCLTGESGQLLHFGTGTMSGYWMDQELTDIKMKPFGEIKIPVVRTGDYFIRTEDGRYQYEGRKDDMIKHAGRRFFLSEIETCIRSSNLVKDVFLIHVPESNINSLGKDKILSFVIVKDDVTDAPSLLKIYCTSMLETFKVPDEFIVCSAFPMTSSFKVDGPALLKLGRLSGNK